MSCVGADSNQSLELVSSRESFANLGDTSSVVRLEQLDQDVVRSRIVQPNGAREGAGGEEARVVGAESQCRDDS